MGTIVTITTAAGAAKRVDAGFRSKLALILRGLAWLDARLEKRRTRLALLELTDEQLKDIGLSRADAYREASRPFWR